MFLSLKKIKTTLGLTNSHNNHNFIANEMEVKNIIETNTISHNTLTIKN